MIPCCPISRRGRRPNCSAGRHGWPPDERRKRQSREIPTCSGLGEHGSPLNPGGATTSSQNRWAVPLVLPIRPNSMQSLQSMTRPVQVQSDERQAPGIAVLDCRMKVVSLETTYAILARTARQHDTVTDRSDLNVGGAWRSGRGLYQRASSAYCTSDRPPRKRFCVNRFSALREQLNV